MAAVEPRPPVQPGEPAPDFALPAVNREGIVSLADYRGSNPLLLALYRGLHCAFCRRHVVQLGVTAENLRGIGVRTLAVVATQTDRARLYRRFHPTGYPVAADPDRTTHRAYGVPQIPRTPAVRQIVRSHHMALARELQLPVPDAEASRAIAQVDGFERTDSDIAEAQGPRRQLAGQFLVDRGGTIRWINIEAKEGLAGLDNFPTDEELLAAARAL